MALDGGSIKEMNRVVRSGFSPIRSVASAGETAARRVNV